MTENKQLETERIEALKQILLRLHEGASPDSVQADFDKHFKNVSAIEISLMEHQLMEGDHGIHFEDVMKLCNVHANLLGGAVDDVDSPEAAHPGHPVQVFKNENMAFQASLIRINRILNSLEKDTSLLSEKGIMDGLKNQLILLGEFFIHYDRKEQLFFPIMERSGHLAPPKVMWGVDDEIRGLYKVVMKQVNELPTLDLADFLASYRAFEHEFKEMIFKEESILLPMVLSFFTEDDWIAIAEDSDAIGYAIIEPEEKWVPQRTSFIDEKAKVPADDANYPATENMSLEQLASQVAQLSEKVATLSQKVDGDIPVKQRSASDNISFGGGYLTVNQLNHVLNNLPLEITFVDKDDVFKYFNQRSAEEEMMLIRTPSMVGRNVENCHPPKSLDKVMTLIADLKARRRDSESMWFKRGNQRIHITYKGVFDENGDYLGILEYVQDVQPFIDLPSEMKTELSPLEK